ncbi:PorP/SprF family type IX secretion system membrane protein [Bacteroidota bacterium]
MKRLKLAFLLTYIAFAGIAQDVQFSQFYAAPLYLGPSFAGASGGGRISSIYRNQWWKVPGSYNTYALSADYYFSNYKSGIGLLMLRDEEGDNGIINKTNIQLLYSYNFDISRDWKIRPGLSAYYYIKSIDLHDLRTGDMILTGGSTSIESGIQGSLQPIYHFDFNTSVLAYSERYWVGFTLDHMMSLSPVLAKKIDEYLPLRYSVYGGAKFPIIGRTRKVYEESVTVAVNFTSQSKLNYLDLGVYYTLEPLILGIWYRGVPVFGLVQPYYNLMALSFNPGFKYKAWRIGYSYDFTLSKLVTTTGGAHEISLTYTFKERTRRRVRHHMVPCPVL